MHFFIINSIWFLIFLSLFLFVDSWTSYELIFVIICLLPSYILSNQLFAKKKIDLFEPVSIILLVTALGISLRSIYMVVTKDPQLMNNQNIEFFIPYSILVFLSILTLLIGYNLTTKRIKLNNLALFKYDVWWKNRLYFVITIYFLLGLLGTILFLREFGFDASSVDITSLSKKYFKQYDGVTIRGALGYHRWLASLSKISFFLYLAYVAKKRKTSLFNVAILLLLGIGAISFPFLSSSRSSIILILITATMIWYYLHKVSISSIFGVAIVTIILFMTLSVLRKDRYKIESVGDVIGGLKIERLVSDLLADRNLLGISKTGHIIHGTPKKIPYYYGKSYLILLATPIPRSIWKNKPPNVPGVEIAHNIYNYNRKAYTGIPPGLIAEFYYNFSYPGIFLGMFIIGVFLKFIYSSFNLFLRDNKNAALIFATVIVNFNYYSFGNSLNVGITTVILDLIPIFIGILIISKYK